MLKYPISVFLDTNIFIATKYDFSYKGILNTLSNFVDDGKIKLCISSIVKGEVESHINNEFSKLYTIFKNSRSKVFESISEDYLNQWSFSYLFNRPNKKQMLDEVLNDFENFLRNTDADILDCTGVDCNQIILNYFAGNPPFDNKDKKKFEFPDAIMISKIKMVFNEHYPVFVVSSDVKFKEALHAHNGIRTFKSLKEVFDLINKEEKIYSDVINYLSQNYIHEKLCNGIQIALENETLDIDGLDYDRKGFCEGYDYDEVYTNSVDDVDFEFEYVDEITDDIVKVTVNTTALISASCYYLDIYNSIWDSEEKRYLYSEWINVEEQHNPKFECNLIFDIENEPDNNVVSFKLKNIRFDLVLNKYTRINREIVEPSDPEEDARAEMFDAMEEYYKH